MKTNNMKINDKLLKLSDLDDRYYKKYVKLLNYEYNTKLMGILLFTYYPENIKCIETNDFMDKIYKLILNSIIY